MYTILIMSFYQIQNRMIFLKKLNLLFKLLLMVKTLAFLHMDKQDLEKLLQWKDPILICFLISKTINRLNFLEFCQESQFLFNRKSIDSIRVLEKNCK